MIEQVSKVASVRSTALDLLCIMHADVTSAPLSGITDELTTKLVFLSKSRYSDQFIRNFTLCASAPSTTKACHCSPMSAQSGQTGVED